MYLFTRARIHSLYRHLCMDKLACFICTLSLSHSAVIDTLQEENENLKKDLALAGSKQNESKVSHLTAHLNHEDI